jgi:hypothetical protein
MEENKKQEEVRTDDLIRKNLEVSEEILSLTKYIKRYVFWRRIMTWVKLFLIVIPVILAVVYLPPFLQEVSVSIQEFMSNFTNIQNLPNSLE